jgi:CHASE3 domain sensor protein
VEPLSEETRSSFTFAFVLLFVWCVMSFAHVYDRHLVQVNESLTKDSMVVGRLNVIVDALDHLVVDQQAFLSTGEDSFQDDVVASVESLELNINALNLLATKNKSWRALPVELSRTVEQVIRTVGESDGIREARGKAAAVDFFASKADDVSRAKRQADQLRFDIIRSIADRSSTSRFNITVLVSYLRDLFGNKKRKTIMSRIGPIRGRATLSNKGAATS